MTPTPSADVFSAKNKGEAGGLSGTVAEGGRREQMWTAGLSERIIVGVKPSVTRVRRVKT